jgi:hypothetical protein
MAASILQTYKTALLTGAGPDLTTANALRVVLVTGSHTHDGTTQDFLDDVLAANRVMTSVAFTGAVSGATLSLPPDIVLTDTNNGRVSSQAYLYYDTGVESTSRLLYHDDAVVLTSDGTNDTLNDPAEGVITL